MARLNDTQINGHLSVSRDAKIEGTITAKIFNALSDARLKKNFEEYVPEKSILDLPIYKYDFIDGDKNQIGCKAQDLMKICPEIVNSDENGFLSIQESKLTYLLLLQIKNLEKRLTILERKNNG